MERELNSEYHRGFNCFIMKKELFNQMCTFQFGVLFELEKSLDLNNRCGYHQRELAYVGEILYGTFIRYLKEQGGYKIKETQILLLLNTNKKDNNSLGKNILIGLKNVFIPNYKRLKRMQDNLTLQQQLIFDLSRKIDNLTGNINNLKEQNSKLFFSQPRLFAENLDENKLAFWKSFPKAEGDLRIIQEANAVLLKNFKIFCDKLDCKFWLHGGSLVGGLRHSGCVPWDDDIDVAMMRDDFNKVKNYLENNSNKFEIKEFYYMDLGCRSYRFKRKDICSNCFVDIFLYDNYTPKYDDILTDWKNLCFQKKRIRMQNTDLLKEYGEDIPSNNTLDAYPQLKEKLDILYDFYIQNNQNDENSEYILWNLDNNYENETRFAWHHGRIFHKSEIFPLKTCQYEGMELNIPANYEKYVYSEYGIRYLDMPNNIGSAVHYNYYFEKDGQLELAKQIIAENKMEEQINLNFENAK